MRRKELQPRHHRIIFSGGQIGLNPARNQTLCHQRQAWVKLQLALRLLLLTILQLYHLPPPLPPPVSNSSCLFTRCQPLYASCCSVLLYFSRYCTVRLKMFSLFFVCLFFMYYLGEKYYKPITVRYYIADCVSWVPRLTLLDYEQIGVTNTLSERNSFVCRGLTVSTMVVSYLLAPGEGGGRQIKISCHSSRVYRPREHASTWEPPRVLFESKRGNYLPPFCLEPGWGRCCAYLPSQSLPDALMWCGPSLLVGTASLEE